MPGKYYVYAHENEFWSTPFYIGKGCAYRAWDFKRRNYLWKRYAKQGVSVRIIKSEMSECCALTLERILIGVHGTGWLANIAEGGSEQQFKRNSAASNEKRRQALLGEKNHNYGMKLSRERLEAMHSALRAKPVSLETRRKMSEKVSGKRHPQLDREIRRFVHESGEEFVGLRFDFIEKYKLSPPKISLLIAGKRSKHKGWRLG